MISIKELTFGYKKKNNLFSNINFTLTKGGICGLLGKNGAGKSTLLKIICGLVFSQKGSCKVLHQNPSDRHPDLLKDIYYLPEEIYVPNLTIRQFIRSYSAFYPKFDEQILSDCLEKFDIISDQSLIKFSSGQKKKFLISFGLATGCRALIFDEPTNGLDIPSKTQFRKLMASTATPEKLYIISTHQIHDVQNLIDSVLILDEGNITVQADINKISRAFTFEQQSILPESKNCIYFEKYIGGYKVLTPNQTNDETYIDLEIFFNAILANKTSVQKLLEANP